MVKVKIFRDAKGDMVGFEIKGHANAGAHGEDVVCAAISALTQTALLGVGKYLGRKVEYHVLRGDFSMRLLSAPDELTNAIFETMLLGLNEIENINPKCVRILEHGR